MRISRLQSRLPAIVALAAAAVLALGAPAGADIGETIIVRCTHGQSLSGFSQAAYARALKELSADAEEYTDCSQLIRQAQAAAARGGSAGGGSLGGGPAAATALATSPAEQRSIARAARTPGEPLSIDGGVIHPGVVHASIASALSSLPAPLLAVLALLLTSLLAVLAGALRNRVRDRRSD
jgi:hypothetical protein